MRKRFQCDIAIVAYDIHFDFHDFAVKIFRDIEDGMLLAVSCQIIEQGLCKVDA